MSAIHAEQHPLAGQTVLIRPDHSDPGSGIVAGAEVWVEDWADRLWETSWSNMVGNPTAIKYALRIIPAPGIPGDDEVVYCKIDGLANLIHHTELEGF